MKNYIFFVPAFGILLSGCGMINESMQGMEINRQVIDQNTYAIYENAQAVEGANRGIEENRRQLEAVNQTLQTVLDSEK